MSEEEKLQKEIQDHEDKKDWNEQRLDREIHKNLKPSPNKEKEPSTPNIANDPVDW